MKTEKPRRESRAGMQGIKKCHQQIPYRLMATLLVILSARLTLLIDQFTDESTFGNDKTSLARLEITRLRKLVNRQRADSDKVE